MIKFSTLETISKSKQSPESKTRFSVGFYILNFSKEFVEYLSVQEKNIFFNWPKMNGKRTCKL